MSDSWTPILDDSLLDQAGEAIDGITADLDRLNPEDVGARKSDLALYFAYLARSGWPAAYEDRASAWLDSAIDDASASPLGPALYGGVAGVAWTSEHISILLNEAKDVANAPDGVGDEADPNDDIDNALVEFVREEPWGRPYDLISGLVGVGVYFLERSGRERAREGLEQIVQRLDEISEHDGDEVRWHTPVQLLPPWQQELAPNGYYNLGMAHGIPGIVALLAHCVSRRIAIPLSERLLAGAMRWLLARQRIASDDSQFDSWIAPGADETHSSRLAWCYGDPGVAVAMLSAGLATGESRWTTAGLQLALACSERPRSRAGITDAGLCHGAGGLAHLFNRLFQMTGHERLRDAACEWFSYALELRGDQGYGGYQSYVPMGVDGTRVETPWRNDAGFLTGAAGIALALLAGSTATAPEWDRLLLTAPPLTTGPMAIGMGPSDRPASRPSAV